MRERSEQRNISNHVVLMIQMKDGHTAARTIAFHTVPALPDVMPSLTTRLAALIPRVRM
jgi:hypothetical protein